MKHIVHVSNDFAPISAGINTHLQNLLTELDKQNFKVTLLVPTISDGTQPYIYEDVSYKSFNCIRVSYTAKENRFLKLISLTKATTAGLKWIEKYKSRPDLIHQHDNRATRIGATHYARKKNIPVIWTNHSSGFFKRCELSARLLTYIPGIRPDGVIVVHRMLLNRFRDYFGGCQVGYIPNGVNPDHFRPGNIHSADQTVILFPQRMIPQKGAYELAKAAKEIFESDSNVRISFHFAGSELSSNRNEKTIEKVKQLLAPYHDEKRVSFLGNPSYEEMPKHYQKADIVALPLQIETENISVFEAWASGTPLITTERVEKNGYMKHEENCLIVPDKDPQQLSEAILRLANNFTLRQRLAMNGRELVENQFTWFLAAEKTADFYRKFFNG